MQDIPLDVSLLCASTVSTSVGGQCDVNTTVDTLISGAAPEGQAFGLGDGRGARVRRRLRRRQNTTPNTLFMVQAFTP